MAASRSLDENPRVAVNPDATDFGIAQQQLSIVAKAG
jgi:hypothetical protein